MAQPIRLALIAGYSLAILAGPARAQQPPAHPPSYAMVPASPSDIYVQGKFDSTGTYVPAHYEPKPKPQFHGYFDKNMTTVKHGYFDTPPVKPVKPPPD